MVNNSGFNSTKTTHRLGTETMFKVLCTASIPLPSVQYRALKAKDAHEICMTKTEIVNWFWQSISREKIEHLHPIIKCLWGTMSECQVSVYTLHKLGKKTPFKQNYEAWSKERLWRMVQWCYWRYKVRGNTSETSGNISYPKPYVLSLHLPGEVLDEKKPLNQMYW